MEHHVGWAVDPQTSRVDFMLRHLGVGTIAGRFNRFTGTVLADAAYVLRAFDLTLDAASLDTGSAAPTGQMHVARLFGSDEHPAIQLRSTWARPIAHGRYQIDALLTMHGETHYVELTADPGELDTDRAGRRIYVARAEGTIDRRQWRVSVHPILEAGGLLLGHDVHVRLMLGAPAEHDGIR